MTSSSEVRSSASQASSLTEQLLNRPGVAAPRPATAFRTKRADVCGRRHPTGSRRWFLALMTSSSRGSCARHVAVQEQQCRFGLILGRCGDAGSLRAGSPAGAVRRWHACLLRLRRGHSGSGARAVRLGGVHRGGRQLALPHRVRVFGMPVEFIPQNLGRPYRRDLRSQVKERPTQGKTRESKFMTIRFRPTRGGVLVRSISR